MSPKPKPPRHWERQVAKYERKLAEAQNPTQRHYALQMKQAAEKNLEASRRGIETLEPDDALTLDASEYRVL